MFMYYKIMGQNCVKIVVISKHRLQLTCPCFAAISFVVVMAIAYGFLGKFVKLTSALVITVTRIRNAQVCKRRALLNTHAHT